MRTRLVSAVLLVCCGVVRALAQDATLDPAMRISQYAHTAWRIRDGFFSGVPHAITQTADGFLWIGTDAGLLRFDGLRFVPWSPPDDSPLPSTTVFALLGARDGSLWIGTARGAARWSHGKLTTFPKSAARINAFTEDARGTVWMVRSRMGATGGAPLCGLEQGDFHCYGETDGIACANADALVRDAGGSLWFGGSNAVCSWNPANPADHANYLQQELAETVGLAGVHSIATGPDGSTFIGIARSGPGLGLRQLTRGASADLALPALNPGNLLVGALLIDRANSLWIGSAAGQGLYRLRGGRLDHFTSADGLSSDTIDTLYQDREGNLWVVTSNGIDRFRDFRVPSFSVREGLIADRAHAVLARHDGTMAIAVNTALTELKDGTLSSITAANGLPGKVCTALFEDSAGRLWVGVDGGLTLYEHGRFRPVTRRDGSPLGIIMAMTEDADHNLWAEVGSPSRGLVRIQDLEVREEFPGTRIPLAASLAADPHGGIWLGLLDGNLARYRQGQLDIFSLNHGTQPGSVSALMVDADDAVWGATSQGPFRWKDGTVHTLNRANGLPCDNVFTLVRDDTRALWLYASCGLVSIPDAELQRWSTHPDTKVTSRVLDVFDGALPARATWQPSVAKSADGRLWFVNDSVLQMVDPNHLQARSAPPPVYIEQVTADQHGYLPTAGLRLPALTRDIEIDYTAPSFAIPEKVQFRYRLDGHDTNWQDPHNRRQAFYSNLAPGSYQFHVIASNHEGAWNDTGATLQFAIAPAYFQTAWFRSVVILAAAGLLWGIYLLRLRQLTTVIQGRMEARLTERERIARELHDTLLQGTYGLVLRFQAAADRLQPNEPARAMLDEALERADQVIAEGRHRVEGLRTRTGGSIDLAQTFTNIGHELTQDSRTQLRVIVEGRPRALHSVVCDEAYWIGREALLNAFHSADARQVELELTYWRNELRLRIRDDGRGIDPAILEAGGRPGHWGIRGMRERAGRIGAHLQISSRSGAGTEIDLRIPGSLAYQRATAESRWNMLHAVQRVLR